MSRPESPLKGGFTDEEKIKKMKALLIKEKKIAKENGKIINDLKIDNEKKLFENNLLIAQIQRLSENIGAMDVNETNKMKELSDLNIKVSELEQIIDSLKSKEDDRKEKEALFIADTQEFKKKLVSNFTFLIKEHIDIFPSKIKFVDLDWTENYSDYMLDFFENINKELTSRKDINNILRDGLEKMTQKCNQMEKVIAEKDEKIESFLGYQKQLVMVNNELDQREERIKRLEELIEDNRNISRALETERDQLQNDLVDLRQRHEEKEGYLIEEYREAQQSLEHYRIFTDKQSAEKANEMERLRKCIDEYQQGVTQEQSMSDCRLCSDVDSLFEKLKTDINITNMTMNYEEIVMAVVEKYNAINDILNVHIERLKENESQYRHKLTMMTEKVDNIETLLNQKKVEEIESPKYEEMFESLNKKLLEKEEKLFSMHNELEEVWIIIRNIEDILGLNDSSLIMDSVNDLIILNKELTSEISLCKCSMEEHRNQYEQTIHEKDNYISEMTNKLVEAGKHVNHNDLMNLEMAEIDKTLINLNNQLSAKSYKITELESIIKCKEELIKSMTTELQAAQKHNQQLEERNCKMKQMLVKTKRELTDCKSQSVTLQEKDNSRLNEVEVIKVQLEDLKVSLSDAISEKEKLQERYNSMSKKMESVNKSREITISSLRSQIDTKTQDYKSLEHEFDLYKVKVQTAFNSKVRSSSMFSDFMTLPSNDQSNDDDANIRSFKKQITELEMNLDDLKIDLREKEEKIVSLESDIDLMRWDNDVLSQKLKSTTKDNNELTVKMQHVSEQLQNDTKLQQISYSDTLQRLNSEKENLGAIHQKQMESLRSIYELEIENLKQNIDEKDREAVKLHEEIWECREQLKTADHKLIQAKSYGNQTNHSMTEQWAQQSKPPLSQERQQGEGMEMINETENAISLGNTKIWSPKQLHSKSTTYSNNLVPLDLLLSSHNEDDKKCNDEFINNLKTELYSYKRKNEYLTELLNDNEATVARLTEQALLLKAEIRRLENNQERDHTLEDKASKEYLKNVIIKFLHYDTKSDERSHLVPALVTLLSLDATEKELLMKFCKICSYNKEGDGWSSYFSWTGMA